MISLYHLIRQLSICISFVVMVWVPLMFAVMDVLPLVRREIRREVLLVSAALRVATPMHRAGLLATVALLMPVFIAALFFDTWPVLAASIRLQLLHWFEAHRKSLRG